MIKAFPQRRQKLDNAQDERAQQTHLDLAEMLRLCPFARGRTISVNMPALGATLVVRHALGVPAACFPIRMPYSSGGAFIELTEVVPQPSNIDPKNELALQASGACTLDLWFYPRASRAIDSRTGVSK